MGKGKRAGTDRGFRCIAVRENDAYRCFECDHPDGENCPVTFRVKDERRDFHKDERHMRGGTKKVAAAGGRDGKEGMDGQA